MHQISVTKLNKVFGNESKVDLALVHAVRDSENIQTDRPKPSDKKIEISIPGMVPSEVACNTMENTMQLAKKED